MLYVFPLFLSIVFSVIFCLVIIYFTKGFSSLKRREGRHINKNKKISRFGGIAIFLSFFLNIFINQNLVLDDKTWILLVGGFFIFLLGILDDILELNWKFQFFFQILIVCLIIFLGIKIEFISIPFGGVFLLNNFFSFILTLFWVLIIMNAVNWSDGVDGLVGGIIFFTALTLFFLSLRPEVNQPPLAIFSVILVGSILGFLFFNLPPAKIFMGSGGVFFIGYLVAVLAIFAGAKIGATLLVLVIPLVDAFFVIWQRLKSGKSLFQADMRHLHHHLLKIGFTTKKILIFYYFITLVGVIAALFTQSKSKFLVLIIFSFVIFSVCFILSELVKKEKA